MREMIAAALERKREKTQRGIAKATGIDPTGVNRILKGTRGIDAAEWQIICRYLEIDPITGADKSPAGVVPPSDSQTRSGEVLQFPTETSNAAIPRSTTPQQDALARPTGDLIPILGSAGGMTAGEMVFMNDGVQGYTERPGVLRGVTGAYSVYVVGTSMEPVLRQGFLVHVDPHRPASPGDEVVIQLINGQAYIKTLKRRTARAVICEQYSPAKEVEYPAAEVKAIHLIVGSTRIRG